LGKIATLIVLTGMGRIMSFVEADVQAALKQLTDPNTKKDLVSGKAVKNVKVSGNDVMLDIQLGYPAKSVWAEIKALVETHLRAALPGVGKIEATVGSKVVPHAVQRGVKLVDGVKNIIAVASGKGGVGKSTTAVNLALALAAEGARVGILDADIYGPSQPTMLGVSGQPDSLDGKMMEPRVGHGIQSMSIGFMIQGDDAPMIWRGPMATQAMEQLLRQTRWDNLDYLVVDLPPGTGDIQLSLAQKVPVTGAVIVTTPQDIALLDAKKGLKMFEKVDVKIIGLVENMSTHICSKCGHEEHIFGAGGGAKMCADYNTELLGSLPLDIRIREQADSGSPTVAADPNGDIARVYRQIARRVAVRVAEMAQDHSAAFPKIVVQNT
jgi:ATP-binding protein involved in chromosome partitioning